MEHKPNERMAMSVLFPLLAVLVIVVYAGGMGVILMVLDSTPAGVWLVVGVGLALVVGVPTVAAIAQQRIEKR